MIHGSYFIELELPDFLLANAVPLVVVKHSMLEHAKREIACNGSVITGDPRWSIQRGSDDPKKENFSKVRLDVDCNVKRIPFLPVGYVVLDINEVG